MRTIAWTKKAYKQLKKIDDRDVQVKIVNEVGGLTDFPNCSGVRKLVNRNEYRMRVGRYRLIFTDDLKIITIEEVKIRNEQTY